MKIRITAEPISTPIFHQGQDLFDFVLAHAADRIKPLTVLAITSKLFSVAENARVSRDGTNKKALVHREADLVLGETLHEVILTVKHGVLFPTAGIDESNSEDGDFLLLPEDPFKSLQELHRRLAEHLNFNQFGLVMTDSRTQPLRAGVTGLALAHSGFNPVRSFIGAPDLFGRSLKVTAINDADPIAAVAVMLMGESNECMPLAIIEAPHLQYRLGGSPDEIQIPIEQDLYGSRLLP